MGKRKTKNKYKKKNQGNTRKTNEKQRKEQKFRIQIKLCWKINQQRQQQQYRHYKAPLKLLNRDCLCLTLKKDLMKATSLA